MQTALTTGIMSIQGIVMNNDEIRAVATFVTGKQFGGEALPQAGILPRLSEFAAAGSDGGAALDRMGWRG